MDSRKNHTHDTPPSYWPKVMNTKELLAKVTEFDEQCYETYQYNLTNSLGSSRIVSQDFVFGIVIASQQRTKYNLVSPFSFSLFYFFILSPLILLLTLSIRLWCISKVTTFFNGIDLIIPFFFPLSAILPPYGRYSTLLISLHRADFMVLFDWSHFSPTPLARRSC